MNIGLREVWGVLILCLVVAISCQIAGIVLLFNEDGCWNEAEMAAKGVENTLMRVEKFLATNDGIANMAAYGIDYMHTTTTGTISTGNCTDSAIKLTLNGVTAGVCDTTVSNIVHGSFSGPENSISYSINDASTMLTASSSVDLDLPHNFKLYIAHNRSVASVTCRTHTTALKILLLLVTGFLSVVMILLAVLWEISPSLQVICTDLQNLSWMGVDTVLTENRRLSHIKDIKKLQESVLRLTTSLRACKPYLPDTLMTMLTEGDKSTSESGNTEPIQCDESENQKEVQVITCPPKANHCGIKFQITTPSDQVFEPPFVAVDTPVNVSFNSTRRQTIPANSPTYTGRRKSAANAMAAIRRASAVGDGLLCDPMKFKEFKEARLGDSLGGSSTGGPPISRRRSSLFVTDKEFTNENISTRMAHKKGSLLAIELGISEVVDEDPAETYNLAASLVSVMLDIIRNENGVVLDLRADKILAAWNTHRPCLRHALEASHAAVSISQSLDSVDKDAMIDWSAAITSGMLYSGHIGNDKRRAPFVLGPAVEQANQLNKLSELLEAPVLLSETVHDLIKDHITTRPIDVVQWEPNGRSQLVYELAGAGNPMMSAWKEGFAAFADSKYSEAVEKLTPFTHSPVEDMDSQATRLVTLATDAVQKRKHLPIPYCRRAVKLWQDWDEKTGSFLETSMVSAQSNPGIKKGRRKRNSSQVSSLSRTSKTTKVSHTEDLMHAIEKSRHGGRNSSLESDPWKNSDGSDDSDSDGFGLDLPAPSLFVDSGGSKWRRSDKLLGAGAFGEVWLGMGEDGSLVALKCLKVPPAPEETPRSKLRKSRPSTDSVTSIINEVDVLSQFREDSLVSFISAGVYEKHIIIVMEFVSGGSLAGLLDQFGSIPETTSKRYTKDILAGLAYLHRQDVVHRDLKPANVLMHADGQCKLADFGTSSKLSTVAVGNDLAGTPLFMAPEACRGKTVKASDIWSLGLTVTQMLLGDRPFQYATSVPKENQPFMRWLCREEGEIPLPPKEYVGEAAFSFIKRALLRDPAPRATADQLLKDPFVF